MVARAKRTGYTLLVSVSTLGHEPVSAAKAALLLCPIRCEGPDAGFDRVRPLGLAVAGGFASRHRKFDSVAQLVQAAKASTWESPTTASPQLGTSRITWQWELFKNVTGTDIVYYRAAKRERPARSPICSAGRSMSCESQMERMPLPCRT